MSVPLLRGCAAIPIVARRGVRHNATRCRTPDFLLVLVDRPAHFPQEVADYEAKEPNRGADEAEFLFHGSFPFSCEEGAPCGAPLVAQGRTSRPSMRKNPFLLALERSEIPALILSRPCHPFVVRLYRLVSIPFSAMIASNRTKSIFRSPSRVSAASAV